MTARLTAIRRQRVPFAPGGPVRAVRRGEAITLIGLGPDNLDTRWVDLHADGSLDGPFSLPFAVENAASDGESLVLSGNEPGSDSAVVLVVDADRTVTDREVVEGGTLTRWPLPAVTGGGRSLTWESTDGLYWSVAGQSPTRVGGPGETNALAIAASEYEERAMIVRSRLDGSADVLAPPDGSWRRLAIDGWVERADIAPWHNGYVVAATRRGDRRLALVVVDPGAAAAVPASIDAPGTGPVLSGTVDIAAAGDELVVVWAETSRSREPGGGTGTVDHQAVTVLDADLGVTGVVDWLPLDPAGALHHSLVAAGGGRIVVVHGADDAFVTEFVVEQV